MKKAIATGIALVLMLFLLPSCAVGVPQEEYDRVSSDLAAAQTQIQSLQDDLTKAEARIQSLQGDLTEAEAQIQSLQGDLAKAQAQIQPSQDDKEIAEEKRAEALAYAEYLDILLYPLWEEAGLTPRFAFENDFEWMLELKSRTDDIGDAELSNYLEELMEQSEGAMERMWCHCLDRIENALK